MEKRNRRSNSEEIFTALEQKLSALYPVEPDPGFVTSLRSRLTSKERVTMESRPRSIAAAFVFLGIGLFSGILIFWIYKKYWGTPA